MSAEPSIAYYIDAGEAYAYNPLFPDQKVEMNSILIDDLQRVADSSPADYDFFDMVTNTLRQMYIEKYMS